MKVKPLIVGMVFLIMTMLLASCGISEELYTATLAERDSLAENLRSVQSELDAAKSEILTIQGELDSIQAEFQSVKDGLNAKIKSTESELDAKTSELNSIKSQLDTVVSEKNALQVELDDINLIYPPGEFGSLGELERWVSDNRQPIHTYLDETFRSALRVQQLGLQDGYLISVIYDEDETDPNSGWILNGALVNGRWYVWDPEHGEIFHWFSDWLLE